MKNGKRPNKQQKEAMKAYRLNPNNWLVVKSLPEELHIVNRDPLKMNKVKVIAT